MGNYTIFRCSKILGEAGKQEVLQQVLRKFQISDRRPNRYFPKTDVGCLCFNGCWGVSIILIRIIVFFFTVISTRLNESQA